MKESISAGRDTWQDRKEKGPLKHQQQDFAAKWRKQQESSKIALEVPNDLQVSASYIPYLYILF